MNIPDLHPEAAAGFITTEGSLFKTLIEALSGIISSIVLQWTPEGVSCVGYPDDRHTAHSMMVKLQLYSDRLCSYYLKGDVPLISAVDSKAFAKMTHCLKQKGYSVCLYVMDESK
jgi:hypothetical protein